MTVRLSVGSCGLVLTAATCGGSSGPVPPSEPPQLVKVNISPRAPTIRSSDSVHFQALVHRSDGQDFPLPVAWIVSGGSVDSGGAYIPPPNGGSFRIIAAVLGHNLNDTTMVTVLGDSLPPQVPNDTTVPPPPEQPPPPPPPPPPPGTPDTTTTPPPPVGPQNACANEPPGLTPITERTFDAKTENGWQERGDKNFSIVADSGALKSAPLVGEAKYPAGFPSGSGPIATWFLTTTNPRTMFMCFWLKMSDNWVGNVTGVNKVIFFSIANGNRVFLNARGAGQAGLSAEIDFQGMGTVDNVGYQHQVSWNGYPNLNPSAAALRRGQWTKWEVLLVANTPGRFDGEAHWWINGNKVGQLASIGYSGTSETGNKNVWAGLLWNPTYGGGGPGVILPQYMWIDHIYVSGK